MADGTTANRGFTLPEVGLSPETWGTKLNANWSALDAILSSTTGLFLPRTGGSVTGPITHAADPTNNNHLARKSYVDGKLALTGGTMTGYITLHADPTAAQHPATKGYVDTALQGGLAPADGDTRYVRTGADSSIGTYRISTTVDPTSANHLVRKSYVDNIASSGLSQATADGRYLRLTGDTMQGPLVLQNQTPTGGNQAVTKSYLDGLVSERVSKAGDIVNGPIDVRGEFIVQRQDPVFYGRHADGTNAFYLSKVDTSSVTTFRAYTPSGASWQNFTFNGNSGDFGVPGTINGNGSGLTSLNATQLTSGTIPGARIPSDVVRTGMGVTAGLGLAGGGDFTSLKTIELGLPSSITATSINSRTTSSHTHSISSATIRDLYADTTLGAIGSTALMRNASGATLLAGNTANGADLRWASVLNSISGGPGSGTWRAMGYCPNGDSTLFLRVS